MSFLDKAGDFIAHLTGTAAPGKATEAQLAAPTVDYKSEIERSRNTAAPTIAQTQLGPAAQATAQQAQSQNARAAQFGVDQTGRNFQTELAQRLQQQAQGNGPSIAQLAFQQNQEANLQAAQSQIASNSRGLNAGLAARNLANTTAQANIGAANQAAQIGMQERMNANQQLGQVGASIYGQDTTIAQQNAQLEQQAALQNAQLGTQASLQNAQLGSQAALANASAQNQFALQGGQMTQQVNMQNAANQLAQQGMNNQQIQAYLSSANQRDIAQLGAAQTFQSQLQQRYANEQAAYGKLFGGITAGAGSALGMSSISALGGAK